MDSSGRKSVVDGGARAHRPLLGVGIVLLSFLALAFSQTLFSPRPAPPVGGTPPFAGGGPPLLWMALELSLLLLACWASDRRSARRGDGPYRRLGSAVFAAGATGALLSVGTWTVLRHHAGPPFPPLGLAASMLFGFFRGLLACGLWALAFVYPVAMEAERWRSESELARLRAHLEPHFLLNTLNAIAGLVTENPEEARRLIVLLGDLLRSDFAVTGDRHTVRAEIDWLQRYTSIFEARHRGMLRFEWNIAAEVEAALIPRFLLQPLVENAIKHGALRRRDGSVSVAVFGARGDMPPGIVCVVEDNGPGLSNEAPRPEAFGLRSVRRRLLLECPGGAFRLVSAQTGTRAIIELRKSEGRSDR